MSLQKHQNLVKLQAKRNVELWIYSFADMYMILSVFFIAVAVLFAAKSKMKQEELPPISAGRGPDVVISSLNINFNTSSIHLSSEAIANLKLLVPVLLSSNGFIDIEGYAVKNEFSDTVDFTSDLDLSTQRAVRVAEWLIDNGISPSKIRTFSYGSGQPQKKNISSNRRVLIKTTEQK
ncbi:MAG: OmpA family protein [Bdellovibrionales bacterium]|nr:OmpA family protein [Bdellovibrionales bacterium]